MVYFVWVNLFEILSVGINWYLISLPWDFFYSGEIIVNYCSLFSTLNHVLIFIKKIYSNAFSNLHHYECRIFWAMGFKVICGVCKEKTWLKNLPHHLEVI